MNYQKLKTAISAKKVVKNLTAFFVLSLALVVFFFPRESFSITTSVNCASLASSVTSQPGAASGTGACLFSAPETNTVVPLCQTVPSANYVVDGSNFLTTGQNHRSNCMDLIDLPLCSQMGSTTINPQKNCVKECSELTGTGTRGVDYAVHNRDCIRFCDAPEAGVTANSGVNCTGRKCHQLISPTTPTPTNCNALNCNLLTADELNDNKFSDSTKKYCNGSSIKCFDFTQEKLPYVYARSTNSMCIIHNCHVESTTCTAQPEDVAKIAAKTGTLNGNTYVSDYQKYLNAGFSINAGGTCVPVNCKPILHNQYRCTPVADSTPTTRNTNCDSTGPGATCTNGYCYKTIDCNLTANASTTDCTNVTPSTSGSVGSTEDTMNSWFYRPKPMDKAMSGSVVRTMQNELCYTKDQMVGYGWGDDSSFLGIYMGYGHYYWDDSRSPGMCDARNDGNRGTGYVYLCGNQGLLYNRVSDYTAYHKGYVQTSFTDSDGNHKVTVCLRFNNTLNPGKSCGRRECPIFCSKIFRICSQTCGDDYCTTLTVNDVNSKKCQMTDSIFEGNAENDCMTRIDNYLRLRAVKYGNRICTFLDLRGTLAYDAIYFNGKETLNDNTCISGTRSSSTSDCNGKNTNDKNGEAVQWRTVLKIPYIQNNQDSSKPQGYLDRAGKLFPEQECIQTTFRVPPLRFYNLATVANSQNLFVPPLYVLNARVIKDGIISPGTALEQFGPTDFAKPELELRFGTVTQKLSLGQGYTGYETTGGDPLGATTINTTVNNFAYSAEVFARKEFDGESLEPTFCAYRKVKDQSGVYLDPMRIQCVKRNYPDIDNTKEKQFTPSLDLRKLIVAADPTNTFNSSRIGIRYLSSSNINSTTCNSAGATCTTELKLANPNTAVPTCDYTSERYTICAQREECSKLNNECMQNEIDMHVAQVAGNPTDSYMAVRSNCNNILLPMCNAKKGIPTSSSANITNLNPDNSSADPLAYGWFNEICISSGFENKLKDVVAYTTSSRVRGKCLVDPQSPYLTDASSATNCDAGGKAPNCLCIEAVDGIALPDDQTVRKQTPHEAGLCVDMPVPQTCPAIDYNITPNTDSSDPEYVLASLNKDSYNNSTGVNLSHQYRTSGKAGANAIPLKGHAEFPLAIFGMTDVEGECKGYWKYATSAGGIQIKPKLNCIDNQDGTAQWEEPARNQCVRYSCPAISTSGPDASGIYQGAYGATETGENIGLSHGFATWPLLTKTNDFTEAATATSCITGFKKVGASMTTLSSPSICNGANATTASLYNCITGYSGGTLPTRSCNQLGQWLAPTNNCVRITCPAVNPPTPSGTGDSAAWELWRNSGGARFGVRTNAGGELILTPTNASRSAVRIQAESIVEGTCNNDLGFFQAPGGAAPTRECDELGNLGPVINPCVTECDPVVEPDASNSNNGFAYWNGVSNVAFGGEADGSINTASGNNGCVAGYYPYPYPPLKDKYGTSFTISATGPFRTDSGINSSLTTIPNNIANDTRAATLPQRVCKSVITVGGKAAANVWTTPSSECVNSCVGSNDDSRIGVGTTQHAISNGTGTLTLSWPTTSFGQWAYNDSPAIDQQDASAYSSSTRANNRNYSVARYCNPTTHKWDDPIPQCATQNGTIGTSNATFNAPSQRVAVGSTTTGTCLAGFYRANKNTAALPTYTCSYKDSNQRIDETYYNLTSGSNCVAYCSATANQTFGNAYNNNGAQLIDIESNLSLTCKSGHGNAIVGGTRSGVSSNCGRSPSDRTDNNPYVTCKTDGTFESSVTNDCSPCRNCTSKTIKSGSTMSCRPSNSCTAFDCYAGEDQNGNSFTNFDVFTPHNGSRYGYIQKCGEEWCGAINQRRCVKAETWAYCKDAEYSVTMSCGSN